MTEENLILVSVIRSIKILALIGLILGAVSLITGIGLGWPVKEILILATVVLLSIFLLIITEGLYKRKRWAWCAGIGIFAVAFISSPFIHPQVKFFVGVISGLIFLGLLYCRKEYLKTGN